MSSRQMTDVKREQKEKDRLSSVLYPTLARVGRDV
jgi:hypothetical protein